MNRTIRYFFTFLSIMILVIGLQGYLFRAYPVVASIQRTDSRKIYIENNDSTYVWYLIHNSPLIMNRTFFAIFETESQESIDLYLMSEEQYYRWQNGSSYTVEGEVLESSSGNLSFTPKAEVRYYYVFNNIYNNTSKTVNFQLNTLTFFHSVDYSESFHWLIIALLGLSIFIICCVKIGNPITSILEKFSITPKFPVDPKTNILMRMDRKKLSIRIFWSAFGILTIVVTITSLIIFYRNYAYCAIEFPELFPFLVDSTLRIFLFFFIILAIIPIITYLWILMLNYINDQILIYYIKKKKKTSWSYKEEKLSYSIFVKNLISVESLLLFLVGTLIFSYGYLENIHSLYFASIAIFAIPFSRSHFKSLVITSKKLKKNLKSEIKNEMFLFNAGAQIFTLTFPFLVLLSKCSILIMNHISRILVIDSLPLQGFTEFFFSYINPSDFEKTLDLALPNIIIMLSFFFALFTGLSYYLLPFMIRKVKFTKKIKRAILPLFVAVICYTVTEAYTAFAQLTTMRSETSFLVSMVIFVHAYLLQRILEEILR